MKIDHLLWAVPELEVAIEQFASVTGVHAKLGGQHPEHGTHNALLDLGNDQYLEIIAPDPAAQKPMDETMREAAFGSSRLLTFAVASSELDDVKQCAEGQGFSAIGPYQAARESGNQRLEWQLLNIESHPFGFTMPFFIDWQQTPHPSESAPNGCLLKQFQVLSGTPESLRCCYREFGLDVEVLASPESGAVAVLETPKGELLLR